VNDIFTTSIVLVHLSIVYQWIPWDRGKKSFVSLRFNTPITETQFFGCFVHSDSASRQIKNTKPRFRFSLCTSISVLYFSIREFSFTFGEALPYNHVYRIFYTKHFFGKTVSWFRFWRCMVSVNIIEFCRNSCLQNSVMEKFVWFCVWKSAFRKNVFGISCFWQSTFQISYFAKALLKRLIEEVRYQERRSRSKHFK